MHLLRRPAALCPLLALATLLVSPAVRADELRSPFGTRGQVALDDIFTVGVGDTRIGSTLVPTLTRPLPRSYGGIIGYAYDDLSGLPDPAGPHQTKVDTVWFAPSVDVFVGDGLSVGGTIAAMYASGTQRRELDGLQGKLVAGRFGGVTVMPRVGYAIPLGESFALFPRLALGYSFGGEEIVAAHEWDGYGTTSSTCMAMLDVGLVARVHRNVYFRGAPQLSVDVQDVTGHCGIPSRSEDAHVTFGATVGVGLLFGS